MEDRNCWNPRQFLLAHAQTYSESLPLSSSARATDWKSSETYGQKLNCLASQQKLGGQLSPREKCWHRLLFLCWASTHRAHIWDSINLAHTVCPTVVIPWDPALPNFQAHPRCLQWHFHMNGLTWPMHASDFPKFSQTRSIWFQWAPYLLLSCPSLAIAAAGLGSQHSPLPGTSKPSTSSNHLQIAL